MLYIFFLDFMPFNLMWYIYSFYTMISALQVSSQVLHVNDHTKIANNKIKCRRAQWRAAMQQHCTSKTTMPNYIVLDNVGRGSMGIIQRALHPETFDVVALKQIPVTFQTHLQICREINALKLNLKPHIVMNCEQTKRHGGNRKEPSVSIDDSRANVGLQTKRAAKQNNNVPLCTNLLSFFGAFLDEASLTITVVTDFMSAGDLQEMMELSASIPTCITDSIHKVKHSTKSSKKDNISIDRFHQKQNVASTLAIPDIWSWSSASVHTEYTLQRSNLHISQLQLCFWALARALINALVFLYDNGVVHCDIKPQNILLGRNGEIKLADLGSCQFFETKSSTLASNSRFMDDALDMSFPLNRCNRVGTQTGGGATVLYSAPEVLTGAAHRGNNDVAIRSLPSSTPNLMTLRAADTWSLGMVLILFLTRFGAIFSSSSGIANSAVITAASTSDHHVSTDSAIICTDAVGPLLGFPPFYFWSYGNKLTHADVASDDLEVSDQQRHPHQPEMWDLLAFIQHSLPTIVSRLRSALMFRYDKEAVSANKKQQLKNASEKKNSKKNPEATFVEANIDKI